MSLNSPLQEALSCALGTTSEKRSANGSDNALNEKLDGIMAKAKPSKREQVQVCFRALYPRLEWYLASGRAVKEVAAAFNEIAKAKVCARTFNDMLNRERDRRGAIGDHAVCHACGRPLPHPAPEARTRITTTSPTNHSAELENT